MKLTAEEALVVFLAGIVAGIALALVDRMSAPSAPAAGGNA
jgi:hypothetical protein